MLFNVNVVTQSASGQIYRVEFLSSGKDWFTAQQTVMDKAFSVKADIYGRVIGVSTILHSGEMSVDGEYTYLGITRVNKRMAVAA